MGLVACMVAGCGGTTLQQPPPATEPSSEAPLADHVATEPAAAAIPAAEPLPPEVAELLSQEALAAHGRRAWVERRGPLRFTRDGAVRPAEEGAPNTHIWPNVVVDVVDEDVRLLHETRGLRILVWVRAQDLTRVPVDVVIVRTARTAAPPANDAAGVRLYPGFRLPGAVLRGDFTEFAYSAATVAFSGFVPNTALGPVFPPVELPTREGNDWSMLQSRAVLRDRPNGRVIARFSPQNEQEYFEHAVYLLGEERSGHRLVVYQGTENSVERFEVVGWARTRDLRIEPGPAYGRGFGSGSGFGSGRSLRITLTAGTPVSDVRGGTVVGVAYEDTVVVADALPEGGFEFDVSSPWGVLSLYTDRGTVVPGEASASPPPQ